MPINSFDNYPMSWKPTLQPNDLPLYKALAKQLEHDIKDGTLQPGTMLPPQRELADYLDINLSTISRAFKLCEQKGLLSASVGRGTFVSSDARSNSILLNRVNDIPSTESLIEMGAILPTLEEGELITTYLQSLLKEPNSYHYLGYSSPMGSKHQQDSANHWLEKGRCQVDSDQILFANGSQNAITCILSSLFQTGDKIATSALVYPGIKTAATMLGIQLIPIPLEDNSISIESLRMLCKNDTIKGLYLIPDFHNPTSVTMPLIIREQVAKIAIENDLIVIEDAINTLLNDSSQILPPIQSLAPNHTIYLMSLSKTLSPGLRLCFMATPKRLYKELSIAIYNNTISVSNLMIECACRIINNGIAQNILDRRKEQIKKRNKLAESILGEYLVPCEPTCNLRFLNLPEYFTGTSFELCARQAGINLYAAERFTVGNSIVPKAVRLAITSPSSFEECKDGLLKILNLLKNPMEFTYL